VAVLKGPFLEVTFVTTPKGTWLEVPFSLGLEFRKESGSLHKKSKMDMGAGFFYLWANADSDRFIAFLEFIERDHVVNKREEPSADFIEHMDDCY